MTGAAAQTARTGRTIAWISAILLPLGLVPLGWMTALAVGYCAFDCGTLGTLAIDGLIAACALILLVWIWLVVAMARRRAGWPVLWAAILADLVLLVLGAIAGWTFIGV